MSRKRPRILMIDDDRLLLESLSLSLQKTGFETLCAEDGDRGIDLFKSRGADAVLLDLNLPGRDGVSVCHAIKSLSTGVPVPVIFLTAQSDVPTRVRLLDEGGDDFCAKPVAIEELIARIRALLRTSKTSKKFKLLALTDPLTKIGNRRALEAALEREWATTKRTGRPLGLLLVDIDHFKAINDRDGHDAGDRALTNVAGALTSAVRDSDLVFRLGGDEFALLLPELTPTGATAVAERIRVGLGAAIPGAASVTCSLGVAIAPDPGISTREALVKRADQALSEAKAAGRARLMSSNASGR
jgi:diguanylate cyclase (GGDEF)-like protein